MRRPAAILLATVTAWALPVFALAEEPIHGTVSWPEMRSVMSGLLQAGRDEEGRWLLSVRPGEGGGGLEGAAREALAAAWNHIAWTASTLLESGPPDLPPAGELPVPLGASSAEALFREPAFEEPLRRFASAVLAGRNISCAGCLEDLRPSRDVQWEELRAYLGAFIFVREVSADGKIDLRVGTLASRLPAPEECDLDLGAASHAIMQDAATGEPVIRRLVGQALQADLMEMGDFPVEILERKLNESVPFRVLTDPQAVRPILLRTPDVLDLHGLRCSDCALRLPPGVR